jgi:hypothetical protein
MSQIGIVSASDFQRLSHCQATAGPGGAGDVVAALFTIIEEAYPAGGLFSLLLAASASSGEVVGGGGSVLP